MARPRKAWSWSDVRRPKHGQEPIEVELETDASAEDDTDLPADDAKTSHNKHGRDWESSLHSPWRDKSVEIEVLDARGGLLTSYRITGTPEQAMTKVESHVLWQIKTGVLPPGSYSLRCPFSNGSLSRTVAATASQAPQPAIEADQLAPAGWSKAGLRKPSEGSPIQLLRVVEDGARKRIRITLPVKSSPAIDWQRWHFWRHAA